MVSNLETWNENRKPILFTCLGLLLVGLAIMGSFYRGEALDKECADLIEHGTIIQGKIIEFEPYSHFINRARGAFQAPTGYKGISVKIICEALGNKEIYEDWNYGLKDRYKVGDSVDLYYWDKNSRIKLASVNQAKVALKLISRGVSLERQ